MFDVASYNYPVFPPQTDTADFAAFASQLKVGSRAPDGRMTVLDGPEITLASCWEESDLVIEFGSFT